MLQGSRAGNQEAELDARSRNHLRKESYSQMETSQYSAAMSGNKVAAAKTQYKINAFTASEAGAEQNAERKVAIVSGTPAAAKVYIASNTAQHQANLSAPIKSGH